MNLDELLQRSRKQAEKATPMVRAAAKLRVARVESATDRARGRITLEMALEEIGALPEPQRTVLFEHARVFAAAVEPSLLPGIPEEHVRPSGHPGWVLGKTMLEHGHADAAMDFILQERPAGAFPFLFAMNLLHSCEDREQQLAVMRKAIAAWQQTRVREFLNLFRAHWKLLPDSEALLTLHAVVESSLGEPEWALQGSFDDGRLLFTSGREFTLFEVLHILRHLDPSLAEELIAAHEQLAVAARRYPNGWESIQKEAEEEQRRREHEGGTACRGRGHIVTGNSRDIEFQYALQDGEFDRAMEHAQDSYQEDTDPEAPNFAPKVLWPSAARFRSVLYHAGRLLGFEAEGLLTRVPDQDLQLLANLEFAAAVAGLPELSGLSRRQKAQHRWHGGKL